MKLTVTSLVLFAMAVSTPALAGGKGQAGLVAKEGATVFTNKKGDKVQATLPRGTSLAGITMGLGAVDGGAISAYEFDEVGDRVRVAYFAPGKNDQGLYLSGWMNAADISQFTYECGCGATVAGATGDNSCAPFSVKGLMNYRWNTCYKEARDNKLASFGGGDDKAPAVKTAEKDDGAGAPTAAAFCPHCGTALGKDAKFCGKCGKAAK